MWSRPLRQDSKSYPNFDSPHRKTISTWATRRIWKDDVAWQTWIRGLDTFCDKKRTHNWLVKFVGRLSASGMISLHCCPSDLAGLTNNPSRYILLSKLGLANNADKGHKLLGHTPRRSFRSETAGFIILYDRVMYFAGLHRWKETTVKTDDRSNARDIGRSHQLLVTFQGHRTRNS